jgi:drug/metabolite transporter (DMT)-like permease
VAVLVGILVAASFGSGDFIGGLASRRASTLTVLAVAQMAALLGAVVVAVSVGGPITAAAVLLGVGAGLLNVTAIGCLYQGLAIGQIGQVAPLAAVIGAIIPVCWGLIIGERPSAIALIGGGLAVAAAAMISMESEERDGPRNGRSLTLAVAAGTGFGTSFILFADASHHVGFWPVLAARVAALVGILVVVRVSRAPRALPGGTHWLAVGAGLLDVGATTLLLVAVRLGLVAVVAPVASLAPAFTVLGAWLFLKERTSTVQVVGFVFALAGLAMIATA